MPTTPKPTPREAPLSIRLTPAERTWVESEMEPGETLGLAIKRLLDERRIVAPTAARELDLMRRARAVLRGDLDA